MMSPLHQAGLNYPDATAIEVTITGDNTGLNSRISYARLSGLVLHLVHHLQTQGVKQGDIVACVSHNNIEMICLYWACIDAGWIFLPLSPRFADVQINQLIERFKLQWLWTDTPSKKTTIKINHWLDIDLSKILPQTNCNSVEVSANIASNIILTSGSSGTPKAAVHCLINHLSSAKGAATFIALEQSDAWLLSLPLFHIGGLAIIHRCTLAGACIVLRNATQSLAEQLQDSSITHVSLVPTQAIQILQQQPAALNNISALLLGGGVIEPALIEALQRQHINAYTSYGMTEMSSQITTTKANLSGHHGRPLPSRLLRLKEGVIWVKGECLFLGYLTDQGLSLPLDDQGWFCTHDKGLLDSEGQLSILGRVDNMFICGGENIHPEQLEAVLLSHPNVAQAIVFAIADATFGHLPAAIIDYCPIDNSHSVEVNHSATFNTHEMTVEAIDIHAVNLQLSQLVESKLARFKRPRQFFTWPHQVVSSGLKVPRKSIIEAIQSTICASKKVL
ncbi:o-succinylbenzoate--CoA ligase [Shewanella livingstonensis]|uniref:O-succinylbenzoate--CoA ligase n=1 Tax=Shewanella livingstonensis TaxID=150120 RepID=A0A3G8M202_9GAMM|nr:o-succinylbenzoate--CoA ligase [Shewanella livingstonensis]AZG75030.1 o-succinylbenzoate--CoA ligase [Shewanella livingstonensis]